MAILPIMVAPAPVLKGKAASVTVVDDDIRRLMDDMLETMYDAPGVGLAAPQVGVSLRVIVLDIARNGDPRSPLCMVNPECLWLSDEASSYEEGCLSVPDYYGDVIRPVSLRLGYLDRDGQKRELEADGLLATVIQHEMDHLDGVLFIDHLSSLKRDMILRKLTKKRKTMVENS